MAVAYRRCWLLSDWVFAMTAWFPWAPVVMHSGTTTDEFIDWLRYRAIDFGMSPAFLDCVDDLWRVAGLDEENTELEAKLEKAELERNALRDALASIVKDPADPDRMKVAREVLSELE